MVPTALRVDEGPATETGMGCSNLVHRKSGRDVETRFASFWLTNETEQQPSKGRGRETPAEVTFVHIMLRFARSGAETKETGAIEGVAGMP